MSFGTWLGSHAEKLAIETFSVVLGIVLALAVNNWHERRGHEQQAREALASIRAEIAANRELVRAHAAYHRELADSVRALVARTRAAAIPEGLGAIANYDGLHPTQLLDNAWQTARATQAFEYLPYDLAVGLSTTYAYQQRIVDLNRAFYSATYLPAFANGEIGAIKANWIYLADAASNESNMIPRYDTQLVKLDSVLGRSAVH